MSKKSYKEKLLDPRWQKKRLEILERDNWKCQKCQGTEKQLHVHHLYYINGRDPWAYPNAALLTLCKDCHKAESDTDPNEEREWEYGFGVLFKFGPKRALGIAVSLAMCAERDGADLLQVFDAVKDVLDDPLILLCVQAFGSDVASKVLSEGTKPDWEKDSAK